jgi:hypothetical protein
MKFSTKLAMSLSCPLLLASIALAQQDYIGRYDVYAGYMYLSSPIINLGESGFHTQIGTNPAKWYSLGFDFSEGSGATTLTTSMLKASLRQEIAAQLSAVGLPASYEPVVPMHSQSETYAIGPQLNYRRLRKATLFFHPDLGAIHETAIPHPTDIISKLLVQQLAPSGTKVDWTPFYGFGGGVDLNVTHHFGVRLQADFVRDHLFSDLLNARNTVRFSLGPTFHLGKNIVAH